MWQAETPINKPSSGFTLLETVICLVIMGFIALSIGNGFIYSVQLFNQSKALDTFLPQIDTSINVLRKIAKNKTLQEIDELILWDTTKNKLTLDSNLLLDNVSNYKIEDESASFVGVKKAIVRHIELAITLGGNEHKFDIFVCPKQ